MGRKNKNLSFVAVVLILCLMIGAGSRSVQAAVEHLDSGTAGPLHYEVTYDQDAGTLTTITVTGQGAIPDYVPTSLGSTAPWNREFDPTEGAEGNYRIGRLILGNGVTRIGNYAFALTARFENTLTETLKNAVRLAIGCFPRTLWMVVFETALYICSIHFYTIGVPILFLFGFSLPCYVCALLYSPVFKELEEKDRT